MLDGTLEDAPIFGADKSWFEYDCLTRQFGISTKILDVEPALFSVKWFDYRFMHPAQATYVYFSHYERAYRAAFSRHVDHEIADVIKLKKFDDLFDLKNLALKTAKEVKKAKMYISGIWNARAHADAMGLPYDFAIEAQIRHTLKYWDQKFLPRPAAISSDRVCEAVQLEWIEKKKASLLYSTHFEYRLPAYVGTAAQNDHHEHLLEIAGLRNDPEPALSRFLDEELLPIDKIEARFGHRTVLRLCDAI